MVHCTCGHPGEKTYRHLALTSIVSNIECTCEINTHHFKWVRLVDTKLRKGVVEDLVSCKACQSL